MCHIESGNDWNKTEDDIQDLEASKTDNGANVTESEGLASVTQVLKETYGTQVLSIREALKALPK